MGSELTRLSACEAVARLNAGEVSPLEMIDAALARIAEVDPTVNALPTLCADRARAHALRIMEGGPPEDGGPWLAGLPIAVKDLVDVAGVRTTKGSPIYADHVPERSDVMVEILEARGGIVIAKSNTPEFGAGSNTFNEVFGKTRNPWNRTRSAGGSSGGAAAALATGQVWLATGSDFGGSLRNPASFCSVVGFRPSPGRVARGPRTHPFGGFSIEGPMARSVADAAMMFDAQVGHHPLDPISIPAPAVPFSAALEAPVAPRRVAFSRDLGIVPVAAEVGDICAAAAKRFEDLGADVTHACPDLHDAVEVFRVLRAAQFVSNFAPLLERHRDKLKPEMVWNIEEGLKLTADEISRAERARAALYGRVAAFFDDYDLLLCPAAIVPPFDIECRYVTEVEGHRFENYVDWMAICFSITLTACPAISVPSGFTGDGLPVGLQMVGRPRGEAALLGAAYLFEQAAGIADRTPIDPV
jgi:amidase